MKVKTGKEYYVSNILEIIAALRIPDNQIGELTNVMRLSLLGANMEIDVNEWNRILDLASVGYTHEAQVKKQ